MGLFQVESWFKGHVTFALGQCQEEGGGVEGGVVGDRSAEEIKSTAKAKSESVRWLSLVRWGSFEGFRLSACMAENVR
jgi:hypothetical protein